MAGKAPNLVLHVAMEVDTDNYFVMLDFTEAALHMPTALAAQWAKHIMVWLKAGNITFSILEDDLGKLVSKLAKEGDHETALALAAELLAVSPDPEAEKKMKPMGVAEEIAFSSLEPKIRCDKYHYEQILVKNIPDLAAVVPFETMVLLCDLISMAAVYSIKDPEKAKPNDMSTITRPAIEDHDQNHNFYFQHNLITALRNVAESICRIDTGKMPEVIEMLESYEWDVFRRIGMYLLQVIDSAPMDLVRERLVNDKLFNYTGVHHEYFHLMKRRFGQLSEQDQKTILDWIDRAEGEKKFLAEREDDLTDKQREECLKHWQYRKLFPIQEYLAGEWQVRFQSLKAEFKDPEIPPDFQSWTWSTHFGPRSPKTQDELAQLSKHELVQYLKEWKPSGHWKAPTPDGLGTMLGNLVEQEPEEYAKVIDLFMDDNLDPTYIRHLLQGFCQAVESDKVIPYELVFKLCKWVVDKPAKIQERKIPDGLRDDLEMDNDWLHTKREIVRFLEKVFSDKLKLPYGLREQAWAIIEPLTQDPEPDLDYEKKYGGDKMDPLTLSINTIRGKALHSVMCYAMWVCRRIKDELKQKEGRSPGFPDMPEVLTVLEEHLDTSSKYGAIQTDRAVYGQWFPQLVSLDEKWVETNINRIFPAEKELRPLRVAAWHSYLMYASKIYQRVTRLVRRIYAEEIEFLRDKEIKEDASRTLDTRLVEHVLLFYCWGDATLNEGDLVDRLFRVASPVLTQHAMDFLGRQMNGKKQFDPKVTARLKALWDWRVQMCGGSENMPEKELAAFGWWFSGGLFDPSWAFKNLEATLSRMSLSRANIYVFEYMSRIFEDYPRESLHCLRVFIEKNDDPWFFVSDMKRKEIWTILEHGLRHADADVREESESIVHLLGSKGHLEYRDLLKIKSKDDQKPNQM